MEFILFFLSPLLHAETIFFNHLRNESGLSHLSVNSIYQDESGIIWIGTRFGLNKYDGNKITVLKKNNQDINTLNSNYIRTICGDKKGNLFLFCNNGLVVYNLISQKIVTVTENDVSAIAYGNNNLWVCSKSNIKFLNIENYKLYKYATYNSNSIKFNCILESKTGQLFIGTRNRGLLKLDKNKRFSTLIPNIEVVNLFEDTKQNIWVNTKLEGIYIIERSGNVVQLKNDPHNPNSLNDNNTRSVCEDEFGNYWIGTSNGLCKYNSSQNKFTIFNHSEDTPYSLGGSSIICLMKDQQGTIWIGTYYGGVDYFNPEYSFFNYYGYNRNNENSLSSPLVGRMIEDNNNNLWIGTEGGGLDYLNKNTNKITQFTFNFNNRSHPKNIKSFYFDKENNVLWVGTIIEGLIKINLNTNKSTSYKNIPSDNNSLKNDYIRRITKYGNKLFLGTHNSVVVFDTNTQKSYFLLDNKKYGLEEKQIWDIMLDNQDRLWFSTSFAVFRYDIKTDKLKKYIHIANDSSSIRSTYQNTFFQDSRGRIWLGSGGNGLSLYNSIKDNFTLFNTYNSGIIDDYIIDIKETLSGYLIIATNKGLSFFDYEKRQFINFQNQTVLPILSINDGGLYVDKNGEIYVGSTTGLFSFNENILNIQPKSINIVITDLYVNNTRITPENNGILKNDISYTNHIKLKHNENAIAIEFSCTNYINGNQQDVEYFLSGFDTKWIKANNRNLITYTNLNPGNYLLKIRAKLYGKVYKERTFGITIQHPFYLTWYAYIFYVLLIISVTLFIVRFYTSSIKLKVSLDYEKREREQTELLNQAKLKFFTNISHEFRTPLTLILNQIETVLQSTSIHSSLYNNMLSIHRNAQRMGKLINELLDFRKQEQGFLQLKVSQQNIISFTEEIVLTFKEYAKHRNISLTFRHEEPNINIWFDLNQMEKVIYNLLSNAFKFTPDGGDISVEIKVEGIWVNIIVTDNGSGIEEKYLKKIFDRFFQAENGYTQTTSGTGIGLALAKGIMDLHYGKIESYNRKEGGSKFVVSLLLNNEKFTVDQKLTNSEISSRIEFEFTRPDEEFIDNMIKSQKMISENKYNVLIVEDNQELLDMLANVFNQIYNVETALNGKEGLEKAKEFQPDIIVSDVMMPLMSGIEMCSKLKTDLETSHIPIVLLTARAATEYSIEGFKTGADDYITKPFDTRLLIARCNNLVNTRKQLQAKFEKQTNLDIDTVAINSLDQKFLMKAIEIVEKNIENPQFDVNLFAEEIMMGRTTFYQKLKGVTGQTPNEFILNIRLKKSLKLLFDDPEMNIIDICYRLGFSSASYFSKCFKDVYGVTPVKYRKSKLSKKNL